MHETLPMSVAAVEPSPAASGIVAETFRSSPRPADPELVRGLVRSTGFFSDDEVAVAGELVEAYLTHGPDSTYRFIFAESVGRLAGYACYGQIPLTKASHDLYWIAVRPDRQGNGLGRRLIGMAEAELRAAGGARLYVDTSSRPQYAATRAFYRRLGYSPIAELPDFYAPGDGKIVFAKSLGRSNE